VRSLEPADFPDITGLIVSPPCPTFSSSGLRSALSGDDYQHALDAITCLGEGCSKTWHHLPGKVSDPRTALVVETARWVLRLPAVKWVIAEQVPSVEFLWEDLAAELAAAGWEYMNVETIDAHDLGAVARRRRTFLLGCRYTAAGHIPVRELPGLRTPTMAEALGWDTGHRIRTRNQRRPTGGNLFSADGPAWCLTEKTRSWERDSDRRRLAPVKPGCCRDSRRATPGPAPEPRSSGQIGDVVSPVVAAALIGAVTRVGWEPVLRDYLAGLYRRSPDSKAG
jgi:DNA (cytosine-5)-methyltransferase 1